MSDSITLPFGLHTTQVKGLQSSAEVNLISETRALITD